MPKPSLGNTFPSIVKTSVLVSVAIFLTTTNVVTAAVPESSYSGLNWRLLGPFRGGWSTAVAGHPREQTTFYSGSADGGVWKTENAGVTWQPMFNQHGSASIGALVISPSDPDVIWIGTGQIQQRWDIVDGDGIYRSSNGGKDWVHLGLEDTRHIGSMWVDPSNADIALVAALGHVFGPNTERGIFRTVDGGEHWQKVLYVDDTTGAADIAYSPDVPATLYASLWQQQRHPWLDYFQPTIGANSGIYRSTDGGVSWAALDTTGLPAGPLGRIELAVAPGLHAMRVWAAVQTASGGGLYRSDDGGSSWSLVNGDSSLISSYMGWLTADPANPNTVWAGGQPLRRSTDGGATFTIIRSSPGGDDYHALWIDPEDPQRMITGADQGAVISFNGGESWSGWYNQPTGQFYRVAVDNDFPYRVYSGQQDSGTVSIASRSDYGQITFRDWNPVGGDERDGDVPDPQNSDIVYGAGLGGRISKWNALTGQAQNVSPWPVSSYGENPLGVKYRYDWITPLSISAAPPHAMYTAAQVVFRSLDGGDNWQVISPDLSGADSTAQRCDETTPVDEATGCGFGVIFSIAPSSLQDGMLWVGGNNGRVHVTRDGGEEWLDVTPPGLEDWSKINLIDASSRNIDTAYLAVDLHRLDDFSPRAYVTHDGGANWREIGHGLPDGAYLNVVREDPLQAGLLYAGTSRGVFVSFDDGEQWQSLQLDLPTTGVNDLLVHDNDLVIATQGRALWVLDDVSPLRYLATAAPQSTAQLIPPVPAIRIRFNQNKDTPLPPEEPTGENPQVGAILDYVLPDDFQGSVTLDIRDSKGELVNSFSSEALPQRGNARVYFAETWLGKPQPLAASPGHQRFAWNLRFPPPVTLNSQYSIAAVPTRETPILPQGAFVLPGSYTVSLTAGGKTSTQKLNVVMDPRVNQSADDLAALLMFQQQVASQLQRVVDLSAKASELPNDDKVTTGNIVILSVAEALTAMAIDLENSDAPPTTGQKELLAYESGRLDEVQGD